jgi:hypothetical protein
VNVENETRILAIYEGCGVEVGWVGGGGMVWSKIKYIFWHDKQNSMLQSVCENRVLCKQLGLKKMSAFGLHLVSVLCTTKKTCQATKPTEAHLPLHR